MVTVSVGSEVSGISKASGGRLSRRLTLTVVDAMLARDWGGNRKGAREGLWKWCGHSPHHRLPVPAPSLPFCAGLGPGAGQCLAVALLDI